MVNTHVKHGHVAKPIKKKNIMLLRVARLIVITSLKTVFEISEISKNTWKSYIQMLKVKRVTNDFVACRNGQFPKRLRQVNSQPVRRFNATELPINFERPEGETMSNTATFNTSPNLKLSKKLSFGEEVANSVTHSRQRSYGFHASLIANYCCSCQQRPGMTAAVGMSVFVISLFLMFLSSANIMLWIITHPTRWF